MMESSGVSDGKLARRLTGKATSWACAEPMLDSAYRQNFDEILPGIQ